jgi:hypothetical protein
MIIVGIATTSGETGIAIMTMIVTMTATSRIGCGMPGLNRSPVATGP